MILGSLRKIQPTWYAMRIAAGLAFVMATCGFGHRPPSQWTSVNVTLYNGGGGCSYCSGAATSPTLSISYSQDGKSWTQSSIQNTPLGAPLGGGPVIYIFSVPNPGNWFLQITTTGTCGGKTITCHSNPNPYPISGNYGHGQTTYVPIVCAGC